MAASLSAYWVKFFKGAGFPQDVATKHAVVFSNNRIKPDMLPDLDKPSLKEMGITLMGDMIAILRYAKKVVEETTCEKFLVDTEDTPMATSIVPKPTVKKIVKEIGGKTVISTEPIKKIIKPVPTAAKKIITLKKTTAASPITNIKVNKNQISTIKRKLVSKEMNEDGVLQKKAKVTSDTEDTVTIPQASSLRMLKKSVEQKRTVFDRLGDSSVTSTTNPADVTTTFNITGVGKDMFKRSTSVFKRLGDIEDKKDHTVSAGILKNGTSNTIAGSPSILKNRVPTARTTIVTTKRIVPKTTGTMHADHEVSNKKIVFNNTSMLKLKKKAALESSLRSERNSRITATPGKLASERLISIPAKARLGISAPKQVTFSKMTTVTHVKKADVFSRLGI